MNTTLVVLTGISNWFASHETILAVGCYAAIRDWKKAKGWKGIRCFINTGSTTPELPPSPARETLDLKSNAPTTGVSAIK